MATRVGKAGYCLAGAGYAFGAALLWILASQTTFAQEEGAEDRPSDEELEEVVVVAPKTLSNMRAEIRAAEVNVLDLYNDLNTEPDFDIVCRNERGIESYIPERVCRPRYMDRLEANAFQNYMRDGSFFDPTGEVRQYDERLLEKLQALSVESPALHEAMREYYNLKTTYEDERDERFQGGFFSR